MKQIPNTLEGKINKHVDTLESQHKEFIENNVPRMGKISALHNPQPINDSSLISTHANEIAAFYENMKSNTALLLNGSRTIQNNASAGRREEIQSTIPILDKKCKVLEDERDNIVIGHDVDSYYLYRLVLWCIACMEVIWLSLVMLFFGDSTIVILLSSVSIAIGIIVYFKIVTLYFRDHQNIPTWKKGVLVTISICIFIVLGLIRSEQVRLSTQETGITVSTLVLNPFVFTILSAIPALATIFIVYKYFLSDEEKRKLAKKEQIERERQKCLHEINVLKAESQRISTEQYAHEELTEKLKEYDMQLDRKINSFCKQAVSVFITENMKHRSPL